MFSNGGLSNSRAGNQAVKNYPGPQAPKGFSFQRIFKGPTVASSTFPPIPVYANSGPFAGTTAHFDIGYHSIPLNDSSRNRRTSLYPSGISATPSIYAPRDHQNAAQFTTGISPPATSTNSSSGGRPGLNPRSNSNSNSNSSTNANPTSTKNYRQFSIYASNTNMDTFIYEPSDICSNSEYSSSHISPSPVPYSPALSTDSTATLRSPLSTSSLLQPLERTSNRNSGPMGSTPGFQKDPPLEQAQDTLRDILGSHTTSAQNSTLRTTSPGSNGQPRRSSPPNQPPRRRDSGVPSGIIPTVSTFTDNDVSDTETESDRIAWRNAEMNSSYSSVPAMAMGRRRTLSTLSNISSTNISSIPPPPTSYFPPHEPLPNPPRPASSQFPSLGTDSTGIRTVGSQSSFHHEITPDSIPHAAYAHSAASSSTIADQLADQFEDARIFNERPLRSSPVEMINEHPSPELPVIPEDTIYSTGVDRYPSDINFVTSGIPASSSSSDRSALNYSPTRRERHRSRSSANFSSSSPPSRAAIAAVSGPQDQPSRSSPNSDVVIPPSYPPSTSSSLSGSAPVGQSTSPFNIYSRPSSETSEPSQPRNSVFDNQRLSIHEGRPFGGSFVPSDDAYYYSPPGPETVQPAYTRTSLTQLPAAPAVNPSTTVEQVSANVKLTSQPTPYPQPSQHIPQLNEVTNVLATGMEAAADVTRERGGTRSRSRKNSISVSDRSSNTSNSPPMARSQVPPAAVQWPTSSTVAENVQSGLNRSGTIRTQVDVVSSSQQHSPPHNNAQPSVGDARRVRTTSISSVHVQDASKRDNRRSTPDALSVPNHTATTNTTRRTSPEIQHQYPPNASYPKPEPKRRFTDETNPTLVDATRRAATPFRSEFAPSVSTTRAQAQTVGTQGKPEPRRSRSDGDQIPIASTTSTTRMTSTQAAQVTVVSVEPQLQEGPINPAQRTVRWNQRLICPSPIHPGQRRKGWYNRRGDQLWTNGGLYKSPPPGEEYPVDLDDYPEANEGWMNEEGVRIDLGHRLIPKAPLRSALKRTSQGCN